MLIHNNSKNLEINFIANHLKNTVGLCNTQNDVVYTTKPLKKIDGGLKMHIALIEDTVQSKSPQSRIKLNR